MLRKLIIRDSNCYQMAIPLKERGTYMLAKSHRQTTKLASYSTLTVVFFCVLRSSASLSLLSSSSCSVLLQSSIQTSINISFARPISPSHTKLWACAVHLHRIQENRKHRNTQGIIGIVSYLVVV